MNKLKKLGSLGTLQTQYEWFMVSSFRRILFSIRKELHNITYNYSHNLHKLEMDMLPK